MVADLKAEVEAAARLERGGVFGDDSGQLCSRHVKQAAAGPDPVVSALGLEIGECRMFHSKAGELACGLGHLGAAVDCVDREASDGTRMDAYTDLLDDVVAATTGTQQDKGIESLFSLGEVGSGTVMGFNDYSLVCFAVLR